MFESRRLSDRFVLERALIQAAEIIHSEFADLTARTLDSWDPRIAHGAIHRVEPPSSTFLKVNIDGSIIGINGGAGFVIRDPDSRLMAAGGSHLFGLSISEAKL